MNASRLAIDPLWRCLCPSWTLSSSTIVVRTIARNRKPAAQSLTRAGSVRWKSDDVIRAQQKHAVLAPVEMQAIRSPLAPSLPAPPVKSKKVDKPREARSIEDVDWTKEETPHIYNHMRSFAIEGKVKMCRALAEILLRDRQERPNVEIYSLLVLSNVGVEEGAAWRVSDLLEGMEKDGLQPDTETCHAALKVLAIHPDHLLRSDVLAWMGERWIQVNNDGAHDVAAGLFREGRFEQALDRLDMMRQADISISGWLLDIAVYTLCEASELSEAYRIMRQRYEARDVISRSLWMFFLDKASEARHHAATAMVWSTQVEQHFVNPSSGMCLNVLATAAHGADTAMATEVFTNLEKRKTKFEPVHYELLMRTYLAADPPELSKALAILTIMVMERVEPKSSESRALYLYMRDKPETLPQTIEELRDLHSQGRRIPIAALNVIIECYVHQGNLQDALNLYKSIHTFAPMSAGARKSFADIDTFNLLLKGCREADPPDGDQASFLVSELLALRVVPTALTYDRLILLFTQAGVARLEKAEKLGQGEDGAGDRARGLQLLDWAFRHFTEMRPLDWLPRFGTLEMLSVALATVGDGRCWDVLQAADDGKLSGWEAKGGRMRRTVEEAWEKANGAKIGKKGGVQEVEEPKEESPSMSMQA